MSFLSNHASSSRSFTTATVGSVPDIFICCWSFRYQHCQFPCHVGVTLGGTLICSQMIKPDKMTWGASIFWSAILYPNLDSILTGNLEVPIISWNDISVCSAWSAMVFCWLIHTWLTPQIAPGKLVLCTSCPEWVVLCLSPDNLVLCTSCTGLVVLWYHQDDDDGSPWTPIHGRCHQCHEGDDYHGD